METDYMQELKEKKIWVCMRIENRQGRKTKVPKSISDGPTGTNSKWAATWVTYAEAQQACEERAFDGVGFVIPEGYYFIDIDSRGIDDPFVQTILTRHDSYAEFSFSGSGIHQYGKCDLEQIPCDLNASTQKWSLSREYYTKNPHNGMELYIGGLTNRFAVYTGKVAVGKPLKDCTDAILATLECDMRRKQPKQAKPSAKKNVDKSEDEKILGIIEALRRQKNGEKFSRLFDEGDISGYGSESEADMALCNMIAFRAGPNPELIRKIINKSALADKKWERDDYSLGLTIPKSIEFLDGNFHRSVKPLPPFIYVNEKTEEYCVSVPLLAKYVRENLQYILVRDNGKQGTLKYVYENGVYNLYSDDMMVGAIKQYVADFDETLVKIGQMREVLSHITTDLDCVGQDELNENEHVINFRNGLLWVKADYIGLAPHSPGEYSTIQIPCDWTGKPEPTPVFDRYIHTLTNGDEAIINLLLEFLGVVISNVQGWRMKKALFMVGPGDTGKSVLRSLAQLLIGKGNYTAIDLKDIEARFGTGVVYGTRLAGAADMSFMTIGELKTFKSLTGGDSVFAEFKGEQGFEYTYKGLLWFCMNKLPKFGGDDGQWVYDRIMVVKCQNVIPKAQQDKQLLDKLYAERNGIIYKAVMALQQVIANGYRYSEPQSVTDARNEYRGENSTVISFFRECMCEWKQGKINPHCTTGRIYKVYAAWCKENNSGYAKNAREFREELAEHLGGSYTDIITHRNGNSYYKDFGLTIEAKEQYVKEYGYDGTEFLT